MKIKLVVVGGVDEFHLVLTKGEMVALTDDQPRPEHGNLEYALDCAYGVDGW
jgi:hypothetical protein